MRAPTLPAHFRLPLSTAVFATLLAVPAGWARAQAPVATAPAAAPAGVPERPVLDTLHAGRFDNGKMWTFEHPPLDYFRDTYHFPIDTAWLRKARLGALRIPGCSASIVSPRGLVLTNHHCGRDAAAAVSRPGESILTDAFYARREGDERRAPKMYADQLIAIVDVTAEIDSAARAAGPAGAQAARDAAGKAVSARLTAAHGGKDIEVEIVSLWNGARTSAYVFHRYKDVRLVMTPELAIGYFGGDADNFTYPRYNLDFTFFRLYGDDGKPLRTPEYLQWSTDGVKEGDPVFVIGNPGRTTRLQTVAQLKFRRDVSDAAILHLLSDRAAVYQEYLAANPKAPDAVRNTLFEFLNSQKAYGGMVEGLQDPLILGRRRAAEREFLAALRAKPALEAQYGGLVDSMAKVQDAKRAYARDLRAFIGMASPDLNASSVRRGILVAQYLAGRGNGAPLQALEGVKHAILAVPQQPAGLQEGLAAARFRDIAASFGSASPEAQAILGGRSPEVAAAAVSASPLADSARTAQLVAADSLSATDPAVTIGRAILQRAAGYQGAMGQLQQKEAEIALQIGRAQFDVHGYDVPPDATFSLRIADGVVKSYAYNGTLAPAHTTLYGMFNRYYSHGGGEWALPKRWLDKAGRLDLSTPVDFAATNDIIGGNSGSPVLDRNLRVVGLIFDGNIESLPGDYIYLDATARAVAVDVRGIIEALRVVYGADRLVRELTQRQ